MGIKRPEAKRLPSKNWRIRVLDPVTKKHKSFTGTDKSAKGKRLIEREAEAWLDERELLAQRGQIITFEKAARDYIEARRVTLSPTTIHLYEGMLARNMDRIKDIGLDELTPQIVQDWVNELTIQKEPKTVHNIYGLFTAVIAYNYVNIKLSKITLLKKVKKFKRLPTAQVVLDTFKGSEIEIPVLLAVWCGLRMSEIVGIQKNDIEGDILTINRVTVTFGTETLTKENAKTYNSNRQIRLAKPLLQLIKAEDVDPDQPLIKLTRRQIYGKFVKKMSEAGYKISFHDLRHINASVMASLGIPDLYAMERGGWSNTSTLKQVYQQTFDNDRMIVDKKIDRYFNELYSSDATNDATNDIELRKYVG